MTYTVGGDFRNVGGKRIRGFEKISETQWLKDTEHLFGSHSAGIKLAKKVLSELQLPKRSTRYSAGYDIFSPILDIIKPNASVTVPTGFKAYMKHNEMLVFHVRSGMGFKNFIALANTTGIVDSDYYNNANNEGHCWVKLVNRGSEDFVIKKGSAIAQCILQEFLLSDSDNFDEGEIRKGGFGSTSK